VAHDFYRIFTGKRVRRTKHQRNHLIEALLRMWIDDPAIDRTVALGVEKRLWPRKTARHKPDGLLSRSSNHRKRRAPFRRRERSDRY